MPTLRPKITVVLTESLDAYVREQADLEDRTLSQWLGRLINAHYLQYGKKEG
jgi:hypothetical protein